MAVFDPIESFDEIGRSSNRLPAEIDTIRTHVGDAPLLVEFLGSCHGCLATVAELAVGFLLQGTGRKWCCWISCARAFCDSGDRIGRAIERCEKVVRFLLGAKALLQLGLYFLAVMHEDSGDFELRAAFKSRDFALALDKQAYRRTLDASCGFAARDFLPDDRTEFEADDAVENLSCLLCFDKLHVDGSGIFDRLFDSGLRNFMKDDALSGLWVESEHFA